MNDLPEDLEVKNLLKSQADYFVAPSDLRYQLSQHMKMSEQPREAGIKILNWLIPPIAQHATSFALGALVASLMTGFWLSGQQDQKSMLLALAADHAHAMVAQNTVEVSSSNMHTVKPWLSSQLGYSPLIFDLGEQGFPLKGGRRGFIGSTPVAVAVYSYRQHEIDVYVLRPSLYQKFPTNLESMDGFNVISWKVEGLNYVAISDMNSNQMKIFSKLLNGRQAIHE
jgi:anti-sigma factor RsiW